MTPKTKKKKKRKMKKRKKNRKNKNINIIINEPESNLLNKKEESANDKLEKYLLNKDEEIKFYENKILNLKSINLVYKSKITKKNNNFKNEININLSIVQDKPNNNEISMINQINNGENLESNINNTFYELFTVESVAKSGMINNSTFIQDEDIYK